MKKSLKLTNKFIILLFLLLAGCDFTSSLHKNILKAQDLISSQEFSKAAKLYEKSLEARPTKAIQLKIHFQLGQLYSLYLNSPQKALHNYSKILELTSEPLWQVKSLEKMGEINFDNLKDYKEASKIYKTLTDFVPKLQNQTTYKVKYAESILELGNYSEAKKILEELIENNTEQGVRSYFLLGMINFYKSEWDQAISNWFEYLKREKRQDRIVQTKFLIANAYETNEKLKEAYNVYYSILNEYPNPDVIKERLNSLYNRRLARKR